MIRNWNRLFVFVFFCQILIVASLFAQKPSLNFKSFGVSDRDLLGLGSSRERLNKIASNQFQNLNGNRADTLKILAIRVDFQEDNNSLTTGNGKFNLTSTDETFIDPPPHDLIYFEHQLLALSNYFKSVSHGKLILQFDVFPKGSTGSFTVSGPMSFYAPTNSEELLDERIAGLFQEGFQLADSSGTIDFSKFDSFILFHAGVGSDFALDFDPTPQDIPSVFLDFNTLQTNLGNSDPSYRGVPVNGNSFFIRDGIILPETQSQEGIEIALLGTSAIMFGNQLGLPILFNPDNGRSGIGVFGLMDQGSGNFTGLIPAEPCAWSKVFLGWETPIIIRNGQSLPVAAPGASSPDKIYKIPISETEYFLVENRNRDLNGDNISVGRDAAGTRVEFVWDDQGQRVLAEAVPGVITQVSEYDFGLPGSGMLVWHIDEKVIAANFADNRVNADPEHRGVDLEEADGAQDIGQFYGFLSPGSGAENGVIEDMFWGSNEINMLVNNNSPVVEFTPSTTPNSWANSGANSHVSMTNFSEPDSIMTFSVSENITQTGFPRFVAFRNSYPNSPVMADLDRDGTNEVIVTGGNNVLVWHADGSGFFANGDSIEIVGLNGDRKKVFLSVFATEIDSILFSPAVAGLNEDIVVVSGNRTVAGFLPDDADNDGQADTLFELRSDITLLTPPVVRNLSSNAFDVFVGTDNGDVLKVSQDGSLKIISTAGTDGIVGLALASVNSLVFASSNGRIGRMSDQGDIFWQNQMSGSFSKAPVTADLDQDGEINVIAMSDAGDIYVYDESGNLSSGFPKSTGALNISEMAIGDIDNNGFMDIVFVAGNELFAVNHVGTLDTNFPIKFGLEDNSLSVLRASPILLDMDADGKLEIIVGSPGNEVFAFHSAGEPVVGFPLSAGGGITSALFAGDLDGDADLELAATSDDGYLYVWDLNNQIPSDAIVWNGLYKDITHSHANLQILQQSAPGNQLMPAASVYNYPNPTEGDKTMIHYRLNSPAEVKIKIYDLAGEFVDELSGTGFSPAENEVRWSLNNIESGVYLARVEAKGSRRRNVAIIKIAVVK